MLQHMKKFVALLACFWSVCGFADTFESNFAPLGKLIVTALPSAPFPHPQRAIGYHYKEKFFPAEKHYNNSTVAVFVPRGFDAKRKTDYIVHFHGWDNDVTNVFNFYKLAEQLVESRRNAILIVPQGPWHASDSFGGKLEDAGGFMRFMTDIASMLKERGITSSEQVGKIILSGHSGGYHVISSIVVQGGLEKKVQEVWLFDALYGQTPKYMQWFDNYHGKILNIYTLNGGTKAESEQLMADLKKQKTRFVSKTEAQITPKDLHSNKLVFIYTDLKHNEVVHVHNTFRDFLNASCLKEIPAKRLAATNRR